MKAWYGFNDLETVAPELAAQWDSEKNKELTPRQVTAFSNKKAWWRCPRNHSFQAAISARSRGTGCPYCANKKDCQAITIYPPDFRSLAGSGTPRSTAI